jgi:hypothetical protein
VTWPTPIPGLVIRYSYLWESEAKQGREEGVKDRPCAIVLVVQKDEDEAPLVAVLPVTHSPPQDNDAIEIPSLLKTHLGLDAERSWIVMSEGNLFRWPGPDLRPAVNGELATIVYGVLPPRFFKTVKDRFLVNLRARQAEVMRRTE